MHVLSSSFTNANKHAFLSITCIFCGLTCDLVCSSNRACVYKILTDLGVFASMVTFKNDAHVT